MATVRDKIFLRMKELDVKQTELSDKVGIKTQNLSAYLRGKRTIPFDVLEKICMVLGLTLGSTDVVYQPSKPNPDVQRKD